MKLTLTHILLLPALIFCQTPRPLKILNIRGGPGTGGFIEGGSDEHLSSFLDHNTLPGNHSWGEFADSLKANGFTFREIREGANKVGCDASKAAPCSNPIDFDTVGLSEYSVVILASNNSRYSPKAVGTLLNFIDNGGGVIFISDGNFGRGWGDAPNSDQSFLDSIGWVMNQDNGQYTVGRAEGKFAAATHPILKDVNIFGGEGVSPITVSKPTFNGFTSTVVALAKGDIKRNTNFFGGTLTPATAQDASICAATRKRGRVIGFFDRNTFFNLNGAGNNFKEYDHRKLGINLMKWVSEGSATVSIAPLSKKNTRNPLSIEAQWIRGTYFNLSGRALKLPQP